MIWILIAYLTCSLVLLILKGKTDDWFDLRAWALMPIVFFAIWVNDKYYRKWTHFRN